MKRIKYIVTVSIAGLLLLTSCLKDLDTVPLDENVTSSAIVYSEPEGYLQVLAKLYGGLALTGQEGPAGNPDIAGIDEGFSSYLRTYWNLQQLPTDEAICAWDDDGISNLNYINWTSSNPFIAGMYYRLYFQITLANEFIRESSEDRLNDRGFNDQQKQTIRQYRHEAHFLRALSYWHALDLFTDVPFITEDDPVGVFLPEPITRQKLFEYIEEELLEIEDLITPARANQYGRADQAAVWTLLAKLYLNAESYGIQPKYTECISYCIDIINAGYSLDPDFSHLFLADNDLAFDEAIFSVVFDGTISQTWGGTTFIISASIGGEMDPSDYGVAGGWAGNRSTKGLTDLFDDLTGDTDSRALFHTEGHELEIDEPTVFEQGYGVAKFKNVDREGNPGSNQTHVDTDFHMFRLADVYLMYAEAVLRGGTGGDLGSAVGYINEIRARAYGDESGNVTSIDLDFILDERGRELYWESHRRTDLIRFGKFTSGEYVWPWKGAVSNGLGVDDKYNVYPLPASDVVANPNLKPTPGY